MEVLMKNSNPQIEAIALVLTRGKLSYNENGLAEVKLQLMLGDKEKLLDDPHPYAKKEVLHVIATDHLAWQANALSSAQQVTFSATLIPDPHSPHLQLRKITPS
jgi:hypothetical protein